MSVNKQQKINFFQINNRRYLGSKFKLLPFLHKIITENCQNCASFMDVFGGTGIVAHSFKDDYQIIINDLLSSNYHSYQTFFSQQKININKLKEILFVYNSIICIDDNYYSKNFADTYLSKKNMQKVGFIRNDIDEKYRKNLINDREKSLLITSLIYAIDKIANTVGHYDAYRKNSQSLDKELILAFPQLENNQKKHQIFNMDANQLVKQYSADIVYLDPPYNSRQYSDAYHFLENVAKNHQPSVYGVAKKMDRSELKSDYCTVKAPITFNQLIKDINAKYIIVSYNNTGDKINSRSNAKISDEEILNALRKRGTVEIFEQDFNAFTTGKTNLKAHKERVFICKINQKQKKTNNKSITNKKQTATAKTNNYIQSPLNYTGGKFKLLTQLFAKFPKDITTFYDIFSGGANVSVNMDCQKINCIDKNSQLISLLQFLQQQDYFQLVDDIHEKINYYQLSNSYQNGYDYYNCNSSNGLGRYNKEQYLVMRADYNNNSSDLLFLLLIIFGFNNQIRFNSKQEFNMPVGKRDFNSAVQKKLKLFIEKIQSKDINFMYQDFRKLKIDKLIKNNAFLYLDPPYLLGTASYNENGGWTEQDEKDLFNFLEKCHDAGLQFALSNVIQHKGGEHKLLQDFIAKNHFKVHNISHNYRNANYQLKDKKQFSQEVLVTNY